MSINPITAVNNNILSAKRISTADKQAVPQVVQPSFPEQKISGGEAFRSYFFGGNAVSFGFHCTTGDFVTKQFEDVPCCCCGGKMLLDSEPLAEELGMKKGSDLANSIREKQDYFRSDQGTIASLIADEAEKSNCTAEKAVRNIKPQFKNKLKEYCSNVLSVTDDIAKNQLGENNPVSSIINSEKQNISKGKIDRIQFTEKLVSLHNNGKIDDESYDKIINSAMKLPQTANTAEKMFGKLQGRSGVGVFNTLLFESGQTIEHVHPHSRGGKNDTDNYLAECGECNHKRGNVSYLTWLKVHPEYPVNVQKHIEWFQQETVNGNIDNKYDDYGTKIKATLSKESNGIMELKVLNSEKIQQLREAKKTGQDVDIHEELAKVYGEKNSEQEIDSEVE